MATALWGRSRSSGRRRRSRSTPEAVICWATPSPATCFPSGEPAYAAVAKAAAPDLIRSIGSMSTSATATERPDGVRVKVAARSSMAVRGISTAAPNVTGDGETICGRDRENSNAAAIGRTPMRHWGGPSDYSGPAVYLASEASRFMTGAELVVDGGYSAD